MKNGKGFIISQLFGIVCLMLGPMLLQGCLDDEESEFEKQRKLDDQLIADYLETNKIDAERNSSGFYYVKIKANDSGKKVEGSDILSFYYDMSLLSGKNVGVVNETSASPVKFLYTSEYTLVPTGLNLGVGLMREGETFRFYIPSYLAFESYAYKTQIPANANFIIDVEMVKIDDQSSQKEVEKIAIEAYIAEKNWGDAEDFSSGLFYKKLSDGEGEKPKSGNVALVNYKGTYLDGTVFDQSDANKPFSFTVGSKSIIDGFNEGIKLMQEGEKAILILPSHLAYGASVEVIPEQLREDWLTERRITNQILPYSVLIYEVELQDVK